MHKAMLKFFGFLKSCTQFLKILIMFFVLMLLLYWIQRLTGSYWGWMDFLRPVLDSLVYLGSLFSQRSVDFFGAVFEYKYIIAVLLLFICYMLDHYIFVLVEKMQELYEDGHRFVKKAQENSFNKNLEKTHMAEQKKISFYKVYVSAEAKNSLVRKGVKIDLEEQLKMLNKCLITKTGVIPQKFEEGFLYSFTNFEGIDDVLQHLFTAVNSEAPLDYIICVQVFGKVVTEEMENLKTLIALKFINKISVLSDTSYRYKFNQTQKYKTSQLGIFQKGERSFEVHEFVQS